MGKNVPCLVLVAAGKRSSGKLWRRGWELNEQADNMGEGYYGNVFTV